MSMRKCFLNQNGGLDRLNSGIHLELKTEYNDYAIS